MPAAAAALAARSSIRRKWELTSPATDDILLPPTPDDPRNDVVLRAAAKLRGFTAHRAAKE